MKTIDRYLLKEYMTPLAGGLALFLFALIMDRFFALLDLILNRGVSALTVLALLGCLLPSILALALPMAMMMAAVLSFGRLAHDREVLAFKSAGVGLPRLSAAPAALGLVVALALLAFNGTVLPWANGQYKQLFFSIIRQRASVAFKEKRFIREFDGYLLYFDRKEGRDDELREIAVIETGSHGPPRVITARRGRLLLDPEGLKVTLALADGTAEQPGDRAGQQLTRIEFASYEVALNLQEALGGSRVFQKGLSEMGYPELAKKIKETLNVPDHVRAYRIELHQRIALAFAPLFVILLGVPLGSLARRGGGVGIAISMGVVCVYYLLLTLAQTYRGSWPMWAMFWIPNAVLGVAGLLAYWAALWEARWSGAGR
ncbi:MAG: LptF/LptG family permease [bacterium]